jgi:hypothetical protein
MIHLYSSLVAVEVGMRLSSRIRRYAQTKVPEDRYIDSLRAQEVKAYLDHWKATHDYSVGSWDAVELFCYEMAKTTDAVAVEKCAPRQYPSSLRTGPDGRDWRYLIPDGVVVDCHSVHHDTVWTLNTTVYSTADVDFDQGDNIQHWDHMTRTLLWTRATMEALSDGSNAHAQALADVNIRLMAIPKLWDHFRIAFPKVLAAYRQVMGKDPTLRKLSLGLTNVLAPDGKIAVYQRFSDDDGNNEGAIGIQPRALDRDDGYFAQVFLHELCHYVLETPRGVDSHGQVFQEVATLAGVEDEHQD